MKSPVYYCTF